MGLCRVLSRGQSVGFIFGLSGGAMGFGRQIMMFSGG